MPSAKFKPNIILTGFMGTGKTTVAELIAERLDMELISIDDQITAVAGKPIDQIFTEDGEVTFRQLEADICRRAVDGTNRVVSTGGGTLINDETRAYCLERGTVICLTASFGELVKRVGCDDAARPLFQNPQQARKLYEARRPIYDSLPNQVDTTGRTPQQISEEIITICQQHS